MAEMTAAELIAALQAKGLTSSDPKEVAKALAKLNADAENERNDAIETVFYDQLTNVEDEKERVAAAQSAREFWTGPAYDQIMALDSKESGKPGRGDKKFNLRSFTLTTPQGEFVVKHYVNK